MVETNKTNKQAYGILSASALNGTWNPFAFIHQFLPLKCLWI